MIVVALRKALVVCFDDTVAVHGRLVMLVVPVNEMPLPLGGACSGNY